jgi:hypothetical protein
MIVWISSDEIPGLSSITKNRASPSKRGSAVTEQG